MISCGTDIIEIDRIKKAVATTKGFFEKVFSEEERLYFSDNGERIETLAGFFAAKEAYSKFLGNGLKNISLNDISISHNESGMPVLFYKGVKQNVSVSISHNKTTAVAMVCGEKSDVLRNDCFDEIKELLPKRCADSNKGDFGRVAVVAGSEGMTGAAVLSAYSALRSGCGLVTLITAESQREIVAGIYPEIMTVGVSEKDGIISSDAAEEILDRIKNCDVVVFGPGLGRGREIRLLLKKILREYENTLIIDADGLNALSENKDILKKRNCNVILTPHPGEMSRLCGLSVREVQNDRVDTAKRFAEDNGVCLVLKGMGTVVAAECGEIYLNNTGNCGMATAGTGDVLAGMIGSFSAQGLSVFDAAKLGVFVHGLSGDLAKNEKGVFGLIASDVAEKIPQAIRMILGEL